MPLNFLDRSVPGWQAETGKVFFTVLQKFN
jgi:hypothetical protein